MLFIMAEVLSVSDHKDELGCPGEINPAFSFPMTLPAKSTSPSTEAPVPTRSRPADISIQAVPPFLFPPPSTPPLQESASSSPSRPRNAGHRRGPSEFIGGDGSKLGPGLMSTSPTKGENALPAPGMSNRRRGHAHRRSAAISHHDLANIIKGPDMSRRTGSAPATPSDPDMRFARPTLDRARSQPSLPNSDSHDVSDLPDSPTESSSPSATTRPRVGFSDKLEYIPRPLSIISSATSSSISTIRPSHSLNGSVTSLRSFGTSSPPSAKKNSSPDDVFGGELHAGADNSPSRNSDLPFIKGQNISRRYSPPPSLSQESMVLVEEDSIPAESENSVPHVSQLQADLSRLRGVPDTMRPRSSPETESKQVKRGKSWTDLLSRKAKPEPVGFTFPPRLDKDGSEEPEFSLDDINFDEDSTCVVRSPEFDVARSVQSNPSPSVPAFDSDADVGSVLDLDEVWRQAGDNTTENARFRQPKRALHSSGATGAFTGPGMHYHRRAESAPVMPPIAHGFGFPRYGSNPQMADVFEEEEDDYNQNSLSRQASRQNKITKEKTVDALGMNIEEEESSKVSIPEAISKTVVPVPEATRATNFSFPSPQLKKGQDLSVASTVAYDQRAFVDPGPSSASIRNYAPSSHSSYPSQTDHISNPHGSSEASPLQSSFDVPRLGTAHSSATDKSAWSSARVGEGTHPHAISLDDVPSLVSSSSTMISHMPNTPTIGSHIPVERSHSLSAEVIMRPRTPLQAAKRASLASLSKLMGGSFSERSKLSIESKADYEEEEDISKTKKRHRISRLMKMKFWKSKEDVRGLAYREPRTA